MEDDKFSNHRGEASHPSDFVVLYSCIIVGINFVQA